jgi:hypothetical protein
MTQSLVARKRTRACKIHPQTGQRNCAAMKLGQPRCADGVCCGKDHPLTDPTIYQQRLTVTQHLRSMPDKSGTETRIIQPRQCRKKCRAGVKCPIGECFASFANTVTEARLHEYAQVHGREAGAGNYWELAALELAGERPNPDRLIARDAMAAQLRKAGAPP